MPADSATDLFLPVRLGSLWLPNRVVMAPLTRNRAPDGLVGELHARYYRQRAGAGMILAEATVIAPEGVGYPNVPGLHSDAQVAAWRGVVEAVHEQGGRMFPRPSARPARPSRPRVVRLTRRRGRSNSTRSRRWSTSTPPPLPTRWRLASTASRFTAPTAI